MGELFKKENCMTIPNFLSLLRIALIPLIIWLYCRKENLLGAGAVIGLSGLTDVADGYIARKYHQISNLGKLLDPLADKLTQIAMLLCLVNRYPVLWQVLLLFGIKELTSWSLGILVICRDRDVTGASWFGKANTVILYGVLLILFLLPGIPDHTAAFLIALSTGVMVLTFYLYVRQHVLALTSPKGKAA